MPEQDFDRVVDRYADYLPRTKDPTIMILKIGLILEELLNDTIHALSVKPEHYKSDQFRFVLKFMLVRAFAPAMNDDERWKLIAAVNKARNKLAHSLRPPPMEEIMNGIRGPFYEWNPEHRVEPNDIEFLRTVAFYCIYLLVTILQKHDPSLFGP